MLSLRTAGAGLGTCLKLPNVGYSPPPFVARYFSMNTNDSNVDTNDGYDEYGLLIYEDLAYNTPRLFEAFWSDSKVLAVQTNGYDCDNSRNCNEDNGGRNADINNTFMSRNRQLSPKCFVDGNGCTTTENPNLHLPASRLVMDFEGPTRRSGRLTQSSDITLVDSDAAYGYKSNTDSGGMTLPSALVQTASYVQYNINQDLQTFFREIKFLEKTVDKNGNTELVGKVRVAAFLPRFVKEMDSSDTEGYYETNAIALYDYDVKMTSIEERDAISM